MIFLEKCDNMNWNEITQGIEHIPGKKISLTTDSSKSKLILMAKFH